MPITINEKKMKPSEDGKQLLNFAVKGIVIDDNYSTLQVEAINKAAFENICTRLVHHYTTAGLDETPKCYFKHFLTKGSFVITIQKKSKASNISPALDFLKDYNMISSATYDEAIGTLTPKQERTTITSLSKNQ